jgi:uncharacterized repeat protein (TIGR03806 family)
MRSTRAVRTAAVCALAGWVIAGWVVAAAGAAFATGLDARPSNTTCIAPPRPSAGEFRAQLQPFFPSAAVPSPVTMAQSPLDPAVWYVADLPGRIYRIRTDVAEQTLALDIRTLVDSQGFIAGMALHPDFATNGQLYVYYLGRGAGVIPFVTVIARFTSLDGGLTFSRPSQQILFSLNQPTVSHTGGDIRFGPDGYLYIGLGDGGVGETDPSQHLGTFLRIDVDGGVPYAIPPDNPFAQGGGAPEVWAWGFRNPFHWWFDALTDDLWVGDVGEAAWEELNLVVGGGDYGWPTREGKHCHPTEPCDATGMIDPVVEYSHAEGCAIQGGPVYRGAAFPALEGAVIFGDYCANRVRAARPDGAGGYAIAELVASPGALLGFAQDANGEVALLAQGGGMYRIVPATGPEPPPFPARLVDTGCVDPSDPKKPAPGLIPYDVNEPLWSDGAEKQRWLGLPNGGRIQVSGDGDFALPNGSVLVKSFSLGEQLIETRLFVRHSDGGWAGYTYEWNDAETEALLLEDGKTREVQGQTWTYPSREQCMSCHTFAAGYTLGLEVRQLNRWHTYPSTGRTANQLATFQHIGLLTAPLAAPPRELPFLSRDTLDQAARGYLHSNCSGCHRDFGSAWTPRLTATAALSQMRLCNVNPSFGNLGITGARVLLPGDPARSLLSVRPHRVGPGQMPPLARSIVDPHGTQVIDDWIGSWLASCAGPDTDGDGLTDGADNCAAVANAGQADADADGRGDACETVCNDGVDNDGDGKTDYPADTSCTSRTASSEVAACSNGIDDDGDGRVDNPFDVGCEGPWGVSERSTCDDGLDNDANGRMDWDGGASRNGGVALLPPDPPCVRAPYANREPTSPLSMGGCGMGPEVAGALALLGALRRARRRPARDRRP